MTSAPLAFLLVLLIWVGGVALIAAIYVSYVRWGKRQVKLRVQRDGNEFMSAHWTMGWFNGLFVINLKVRMRLLDGTILTRRCRFGWFGFTWTNLGIRSPVPSGPVRWREVRRPGQQGQFWCLVGLILLASLPMNIYRLTHEDPSFPIPYWLAVALTVPIGAAYVALVATRNVMRTEVSEERLTVTWGKGHRYVETKDIADATSISWAKGDAPLVVNPADPMKRFMSFWGRRGVWVRLRDGRAFIIGSRNPEALAAAISAARRPPHA